MNTIPKSPPELVKKLRGTGLFERVALKHPGDAHGVALVWLEVGEDLHKQMAATVALRGRDVTERQVVDDITSSLKARLKFPIQDVELHGFDPCDFEGSAEGPECPAEFFLFVRLKDSEAGAPPRDTLADDDLFSRTNVELAYAAVISSDTTWIKWGANPAAHLILRAAARAWREGLGTLREVATELNDRGYVTLTEGKPFRADSATAVITAIELIQGS